MNRIYLNCLLWIFKFSTLPKSQISVYHIERRETSTTHFACLVYFIEFHFVVVVCSLHFFSRVFYDQFLWCHLSRTLCHSITDHVSYDDRFVLFTTFCWNSTKSTFDTIREKERESVCERTKQALQIHFNLSFVCVSSEWIVIYSVYTNKNKKKKKTVGGKAPSI